MKMVIPNAWLRFTETDVNAIPVIVLVRMQPIIAAVITHRYLVVL